MPVSLIDCLVMIIHSVQLVLVSALVLESVLVLVSVLVLESVLVLVSVPFFMFNFHIDFSLQRREPKLEIIILCIQKILHISFIIAGHSQRTSIKVALTLTFQNLNINICDFSKIVDLLNCSLESVLT